MQLEQLLTLLGYSESNNYRAISGQHSPTTAHLFRAAKRAGAEGVYVFHTSADDEVLPVRPAVYVAKANTADEAREIHHDLWNLGNAPFLIVLLPNQIRVYTGFAFDSQDPTTGLLDDFFLDANLFGQVDEDVAARLEVFSSDSIDTGNIWKTQAQKLDLEKRVDKSLLGNLTRLEEELVQNSLKLPVEEALPIAHALIGKYVYIRYLRDRGILSDEWLAENGINLDQVLGRNATLAELNRLVDALEKRFNGSLFPLAKEAQSILTNDIIALVASAFKGDNPELRQRHLDFEPYDFYYIPVELLSAIYEQFLHAQGTGKDVGAVYTPEPLADYLLCEMDYAKPLERGMTVFDPCCGSGIFLVLAYRRLIELELFNSLDGKLQPEEIRRILEDCVFGVERNPDACYVAEFSLILTMLNYISPPELHLNKDFRFPELHNKQIFQCDIFDEKSEFRKQERHFDWVVGNPPWIEPETDSEEERLALEWIKENRKKGRPVAGNRVAEASSWRALDFVNTDGCIGLLLHAKSLFNHESKKYRKQFFKQNEVVRITNFSNLAYILFDGRGQAPAATIIYRKAQTDKEKAPIVHCGPFVVNQVSNKSWQKAKRKRRAAWTITLNEDEIQTVAHDEAEDGEALTWKLALWGNHRDKRAINRLRNLFTTNLDTLAKARKWNLVQGIKLRKDPSLAKVTHRKKTKKAEDIEPAAYLKGLKCFDPNAMVKSKYRFAVPDQALEAIPPEMCFLRTRSGKEGLKLIKAPHMVLKGTYFAYSDKKFVIPAPQTGLSSGPEDANYLRALSVFLSSSISQYYLFFISPSWGVDRSTVYAKDLKRVPLPEFSSRQVKALAKIYDEMVALEKTDFRGSEKLQEVLDSKLEGLFRIPKSLNILAKDLLQVRLTLNKGKATGRAVEPPSEKDLRSYAQQLRAELDDFTAGSDVGHKVSVIYSPSLIVSIVELVGRDGAADIAIGKANKTSAQFLSKLNDALTEKFSQWVYIKRGLRGFLNSKVYICKVPRLMDWTKSQALLDSDDLIAEVIVNKSRAHEVILDDAIFSKT